MLLPSFLSNQRVKYKRVEGGGRLFIIDELTTLLYKVWPISVTAIMQLFPIFSGEELKYYIISTGAVQ